MSETTPKHLRDSLDTKLQTYTKQPPTEPRAGELHPLCATCGHPCNYHLSGYTCQQWACNCLEYKINGSGAEQSRDGLTFAPVVEEMLTEPDATIQITRHELLRLMLIADKALDRGDDHDTSTLYEIREALGEFIEAPERRIRQ